MADVRSVVVRLSAETSSYIAKMQGAGKVTEDSMGRAEKSSKKAAVGLTDVEKAGAAGAIALAGMALVASADFEQAMSNVEAATHGSVAEMGALEQAALDAGKATSFSATEAAAGIENLAKAGVSTADILGGALTGSLDLAAAGQLSVADAAEFTATALTQFQLDGTQAAHVADLLAAGAGKAQGEVSDMALALNYAGVPASNLGVSIEETAGSIALLAKNGIVGEKAGTALRGMLGSLGSPSKQAAKEMQNVGINAFDAQGKFIGLEGVAGQLQERLKGLTQEEREQALGRIFGNEQAAAAGVFFREGAAGVAEMTKAVDDNGYAAETAAIKMDNLKGDVEVLMGSIETALIGSGDSSQDSLRSTTQLVTELVDAMSELQEDDNQFTRGIGDAVDQLSVVNSSAFGAGLNNIKIAMSDSLSPAEKLQTALFGVDEAAEDASENGTLWTQIAGAIAGAQQKAAVAASDMAAEVQQSEEQLNAQADALEDARKAAHDTTMSFVDLTKATDGGKASLGGWLKEMRAQANALRNFRENAKQAGENGIKKGLIDYLEKLGPEGARQLKWLADATKEQVHRANEDWKSLQTEIRKSDKAMLDLHEPKIEVDASGAFDTLDQAKAEMRAIDGTHATTYIDTVRTVSGPQGAAIFGGAGKPQAAGGLWRNGVMAYAQGDVRNAHQPQMAAGGEWRVWAEDETQGESYIPHANDGRRPRARQILEDTATILGAKSIEWYAGGGNNDDKKKKKKHKVEDDTDYNDAQDQAREERREEREKKRASDAEDAAGKAEQDRQRLVEMQEEAIEAQEEAARRQQEVADAVLAGQERAWDIATDAAKSQVDAAQSLVDAAVSKMDRIGDAATSAFKGSWFDQSKSGQQHGLWVGDDAAAGESDWRSQGMAEIEGLKERKSLIAQLAGIGVTGGALEALLGQSDNEGIAALIAKGEADDYAALFAEREALLGEVSTQAGMAGYGQEYASASAGLATANQHLERLTALIEAQRPITVLEAVSAAATAAEIARLQAMTGAS